MSLPLECGVAPPGDFSIAHGPFLRVLARLHLTRGDGSPRAWAIVALVWGPLFLGALSNVLFGLRPPPILFDISVHTRLLITIPVLIQAGRLLERRCRCSLGQLYEGDFAERAALDDILHRADRLRGSALADIAILVIAVLLGQAALWGRVGPTGLFTGISDAGAFSFARVWYGGVALPVAQFLLLRWIWQWGVWTYVIVRVSRLRLAIIATHPDHAAGIGFLAAPVSAFWWFVIAVASTLASAWGTAILDHHATLQTFVPTFIVFVVIVSLAACGPLCLYTGMLYRVRHRDLPKYDALGLDYVRQFDAKWAGSRPPDQPLLGTGDIQSLHDLMGAYGQLEAARLVPFSPRALVGLWAAALIPMVPLVATTMPLGELMKKIAAALLGGLPV